MRLFFPSVFVRLKPCVRTYHRLASQYSDIENLSLAIADIHHPLRLPAPRIDGIDDGLRIALLCSCLDVFKKSLFRSAYDEGNQPTFEHREAKLDVASEEPRRNASGDGGGNETGL